MLYLTCSGIHSVDLARYGVSRAKHFGTWEICYNFISLIRVKASIKIETANYTMCNTLHRPETCMYYSFLPRQRIHMKL